MNVIVVYQMNSYVLAKLAASLQHHAHEVVQHCCLHHHALTFRCNTIWLQYWCALQQTFINFVVELLQQIQTHRYCKAENAKISNQSFVPFKFQCISNVH